MIKTFILLLLKQYKNKISPLLPKACRFYPSCSCYAYQSIEKYGIVKGSFLAFNRIIKCNPFNKGGYDPLK